MNNVKEERLQKILSQAGISSRREAEKMIEKGIVKVNNRIAKLGDKATFNDLITVNNQAIQKAEKVYYIINKPEKTICSLKDPQNRTLIVDYIDEPRMIFPVGRLDYNTTGTLLLTNDGELANRLTHPSYEIIRVYRARLNEVLSNEELAFLNSSKVFLDNHQSIQTVEKIENKTYVISLKVGSYHHVKKLFELVNKDVKNLTRIEFAGLTHVGKLSRGQYRKLNAKEIYWLKKLVKLEQ
ncbi:rRNA pseudouridine synthase [Mycoplasma iguanae]|uniref:rRNA pseudouridine synthase n=1 Tax=Mycoplasma iguanae TaxID=292461 RepID=A0ABY5R7K3_9MOLU|nr:pseudouridine synthase [Mycoplasma iguanae]UVD81433.1 rRNA pseudouridine synthase [Mycoplasma iguanae]